MPVTIAMIDHLALGFAFGIAMSAPAGPVAAICLRHALAGDAMRAFAGGLGAAAIDLAVVSLMLGGARALPSYAPWLERLLLVVGGLALIASAASGWRTATYGIRHALAQPARARIPVAIVWLTCLAIAAANPVNMAAVALIVTGLLRIAGPAHAAILGLGLASGMIGWWALLAWGAARLRARIAPRAAHLLQRLLCLAIAALGSTLLFRAAFVS